jgi:hypothetical protein
MVLFPAGLTELVEDSLSRDLKGVRVTSSDDSSALFTTGSSSSSVGGLPYVNNGFRIILDVPRRSLGAAMNAIANAVDAGHPGVEVRRRPFRVMAHIDGELASLPKSERRRLEDALARSSGGRAEPRGGSDEFWILGRRGLPRLLLGWRLPQRERDRAAAAGALSAPLAHLLVRLSLPRDDDSFLDPFAGSGAIGLARLALPARAVVLSDTAGVAPLPSHSATSLTRSLREDALSLPSIGDREVSVIVTDPPWAEFAATPKPDYEAFLADMWKSFARVLDPRHARVVVLFARRLADEAVAAARRAEFDVDTRHDILVNGHPAAALRLRPHAARGR